MYRETWDGCRRYLSKMLCLGAYTENTSQCLNINSSFLLLAVSGMVSRVEISCLITFHYAFKIVEVIGHFICKNPDFQRT